MDKTSMARLLGCAGAIVALSVAAQTYPSKPVRLISPYPPGGGTDAAARIIAQALGDQLGQQVIVDTRGGASGMIGTELAARAAPDGYTLVLGNVAPLAILPNAMRKLPYDPGKDFAPLSLVAMSDYVLTVHPSLPVHDVNEMLVLAKSRPGELTYASSGALGAPHLAGEMLNLLAHTQLLHVPYKGNGPAAIAVMTGEATMMFGTGPSVVPHAKSGKLRMIATTGRQRSMPGIGTVAEVIPGYYVAQWYGLLAPAGTPKEIVERLAHEIGRAIVNPRVKQLYVNLGTQPVADTPQQFRAFIKDETAKWAKVIETARIRVD